MITRDSEKGFSTIEMIVVIVITGILATMAVGRLMDSPTIDAREAAAMVGSDIRFTQELAMADVVNYRIIFDGDETYQVIRDPAGGNTIVVTKTIPGVGITASAATIDFNSLGEPNGAFTITVGTSSVTVAQFTGRVNYI